MYAKVAFTFQRLALPRVALLSVSRLLSAPALRHHKHLFCCWVDNTICMAATRVQGRAQALQGAAPLKSGDEDGELRL